MATLCPGADRSLWPSSRRTPIAITEIMYHPAIRADGRNLEFIEVFNTDPVAHDLSGFSLSGDLTYTFPAGAFLAPHSFVAVAAIPDDLRAAAGITNVLGPYEGALPDNGGSVQLRNRWGALLLDVPYRDDPPWPAAADGAGHSLHLSQPDFGETAAEAWSASPTPGGSPGSADTGAPSPRAGVVINEFLAHTDPDLDLVELYNSATQTVDLSACTLSDRPDEPRFVIPDGTILTPRGFLSYTEAELGFRLSQSGETIYLAGPGGTGVLDAVRYTPQQLGVATGRWPDGTPDFQELTSPTPGASNTNAAPRIRDIVINEIMYAPLSGDDDDEYIELHNRGATDAPVGNWQLVDGVRFLISPGTVIPAGGYLVIARDAARLQSHYPQLSPSNTVGNYEGSLTDGGERVALAMPNDPAEPYLNLVVVDEVTYGDGDDWGRWTKGGGSSLELVDPRADNRRAANWEGSDETRKAPWTFIEHTGVLDNGDGAADEFDIYLQQAGECLVDRVSLVRQGETLNRLSTPDFEGALGAWTPAGNHVRSTREAGGGMGGGDSLRLRASGAGKTTTANYIRTLDRVWQSIAAPPLPGQTFTIRCYVRWLAGWPYATATVRGFWLEAAGKMRVPLNLGTPGLPNSRGVANAAPAVWDIRHTPVLPAAGEPVTVSCRADDPDGLGEIRLEFRRDSTNVYTTVEMTPNPFHGRFEALIPAQSAGTLVAFRIVATDRASSPASRIFPADNPLRECLVRFGETQAPGTLGTYRVWISAVNVADWRSRSDLANEPVRMTFVSNNDRVIYDAWIRYRGNHRNFGDYDEAAYAVSFPASEPFLGGDEIKIDIPSLQFPNGTYQQEHHAYWMARGIGKAAAHVRPIHAVVNGTHTLRQDLQIPTRGFCRSWYGDPDPQVYEQQKPLEPFLNFTTTDGAKKQSTYAFLLQKKRTDIPDYDYRSIYLLADALDLTDQALYEARVSAIADIPGWAGYFAVNHAVGNVDSYGYGTAFLHNMFAYVPRFDRSRLHLHDLDSAFTATDPALFPTAAHQVPYHMFGTSQPAFRRVYWRLLKDLADGPMSAVHSDRELDNWHAVFTAEGLVPTSPDAVDPNTGKSMRQWIADRRTQILSALASEGADAPFVVTTPNGSTNAPIVTLNGAAPVDMTELQINDRAYPPAFSTITDWSVRLGLHAGTNALAVEAVDRFGVPLGATTVTLILTEASPPPDDWIVISELMYHAAEPRADFVELFNRSTNHSFDLSGWQLDGAGCKLPGGAILGPGEYGVIADNLQGYALAYTNTEAVIGVFTGTLSNAGETLRLLRPDGPAQWVVVDEVTYGDAPPWSSWADGYGASLELIDADQDNNRAGNWTAADPEADRGWVHIAVTGTASNARPSEIAEARLHFSLEATSSVFLDKVSLVTGAVPEAGMNLLQNGGFESPLAGTWTATGGYAASAPSADEAYEGSNSLRLTTADAHLPPAGSVNQGDLGLSGEAQYTLSYQVLESAVAGDVSAQITYTDIGITHSVIPPHGLLATPGTPNQAAEALPALPQVWISEVMPSNTTALTDNAGERDPWIELFNAETDVVSLANLYLSDTYDDPARWIFPAGMQLGAGQRLLVWADGQTNQTAGGFLHAGIALDGVEGTVLLSRESGGRTQLVDWVNYGFVPPGSSIGSVPDAGGLPRVIFDSPTPWAENTMTSLVPRIFINEWMADNTATLPDPAGGFDDWFELYNPSDTAVDLSGFSLTDRPGDIPRFLIPNGVSVPARGFLLVWADGDDGLNAPGLPLHVDFGLSRNGETIGLFGRDGTPLDIIEFGPQAENVSEGRWPDGTGGIYEMPPTPSASNTVFMLWSAEPLPNDALRLSWSSLSGVVYRVEFAEDLRSSFWRPLNVKTAGSDITRITDTNAAAQTNRFYKVRRLD